ncbi:MAG: site-specific DNA-methyltransferase [Pseudopedobacter saltans]|uniref:Methyltransferase n=1 Tax=Pseudopedobacter saltans TaxID=151895 RepID=A0A2W5ELR0_9SPHI|nr:MAG: site-specific DNA-methyltransferase [Pseudopedobacter saltans]
MIQLFNEDNIATLERLQDESVDIILTDPPYLYLKGQKLERPFNERHFFIECCRVLKKDGFIVLFGRGESFYRWNNLLNDLIEYKEGSVKYGYKVYNEFGNIINKYSYKEVFKFKEEIVWNKSYCTSPLMAISRVHETVSIFTKGNGTINKVKVPYLEMKADDLGSICQDIKRMRSILKNTKSLDAVLDFLENNKIDYSDATYKHRATEVGDHGTIDRCLAVAKMIQNGTNEKTIIRTDIDPRLEGKGVSVRDGMYNNDRTVSALNCVVNGLKEKTIIRTDRYDADSFTKYGATCDKRKKGDRCVDVLQGVEYGLNEKTIIKETRDHYSSIHPTQKPVRLLERLLALVLPKKDREQINVLDPFGGSFSTMEACINMGVNGISCEIDKEYFTNGKERIDTKLKEVKQTFIIQKS